jgi:hypothetical protein
MSDLVERLRGEHWWLNVDGDEAADEIERLRMQLAETVPGAAREAEIKRLQDHVASTEGAMQEMLEASRKADAKIKRLRAALEPFARNVDAVSLGEALGHINREDLQRAREATNSADRR